MLFVGPGFVIVIENIVLIIVTWQMSTMDTTANMFVVSLAVADLLVGFVTSVGGILIDCLRGNIYNVIYHIFDNCAYVFVISSYVHLTLIAMERYVYISHPFFHARRISKALITKVLIGIWVLSITLILATNISTSKKYTCLLYEVRTLDLAYTGSCISVLLIVIISIAYFKLAVLSYKHTRSIACTTIATSGYRGHGNRVSNENLINVLKTIRFFLVSTGFLLAMTIPAVVCILVSNIYHSVDLIILQIVICLQILHSGVNFFIHLFMVPDFRNAIKKIFLCKASLCDQSCYLGHI